jgi:hypothetical protein
MKRATAVVKMLCGVAEGCVCNYVVMSATWEHSTVTKIIYNREKVNSERMWYI